MTTTPDTTPRAECGVCGVEQPVTKAGKLRKHKTAGDGVAMPRPERGDLRVSLFVTTEQPRRRTARTGGSMHPSAVHDGRRRAPADRHEPRTPAQATP